MKRIIMSLLVIFGVIILIANCFWSPPKILKAKKDYCLISQNIPTNTEKIWFGNQLKLISPDDEQVVVRVPMIQGGFIDYFYGEGYLCYKTRYSGTFRLLRKKYDTDKLYIFNLADKSEEHDIIEKVESYVLSEGKLIYESTSGGLFYYDIDKKKKEKIDWKWKQYSGVLYNIRWRDEESFYITDLSRKKLYCYSLKDKRAVMIFESDKAINGIIPYQADEVIIYDESGRLIKKKIDSDKDPRILTKIENTVYKRKEGDALEDNVVGCPFSLVENGKLYYDNEGYICEYDIESDSIEKIIDFREIPEVNLNDQNAEINYKFGENSIIVIVSLKERQIFNYYDYAGELEKRYEISYPSWETSSYNRNRGA